MTVAESPKTYALHFTATVEMEKQVTRERVHSGLFKKDIDFQLESSLIYLYRPRSYFFIRFPIYHKIKCKCIHIYEQASKRLHENSNKFINDKSMIVKTIRWHIVRLLDVRIEIFQMIAIGLRLIVVN